MNKKEKFFEQVLSLDKSTLFDRILKIQINTYGVLEIKKLANLIKKNEIKKVLDIGTGEGSFLINLAKDLKDIEFFGIDHNEKFLELAKKSSQKLGLKNIKFEKTFFDNKYSQEKFDLILTRFVLQHATSPKDFCSEVYSSLNNNGFFVTIDEYLFDIGIEEPVWQKFMKCWIDVFNRAGCDHVISKKIVAWLSQIGFKNIKGEKSMHSPVTMGAENFKSLVITYAVTLNKIFPGIWEESFFPEFEDWLDEINETKRVDPFIPITYITAQKKG